MRWTLRRRSFRESPCQERLDREMVELAARTPRSVAFAAADALALGFPGLGPAKISQSAGAPNRRCWDLFESVMLKDGCSHP